MMAVCVDGWDGIMYYVMFGYEKWNMEVVKVVWLCV